MPAKKPTANEPAKLATAKTERSVEAFLEALAEPQRSDARTLTAWLERWSGEAPALWGSSIVGFGACRYVYDSGRSGDWMAFGFAPRKKQLSLYFLDGLSKYEGHLAKLGKHALGKGCLCVEKLADLDERVLETMARCSLAWVREAYPKP